jgi:hypothetical protein
MFVHILPLVQEPSKTETVFVMPHYCVFTASSLPWAHEIVCSSCWIAWQLRGWVTFLLTTISAIAAWKGRYSGRGRRSLVCRYRSDGRVLGTVYWGSLVVAFPSSPSRNGSIQSIEDFSVWFQALLKHRTQDLPHISLTLSSF